MPRTRREPVEHEIYITPDQVTRAEERRILDFFNRATTPEEIDRAVEIPNERDVGVRLGARILARRSELGVFMRIGEIAAVPLIGPERFTEIVVTLGGLGDAGLYAFRRLLVPPGSPVVPDGFTLLDARILTGLPAAIPLGENLTLLVVVPTGLAMHWRDADQDAVVSSSAAETTSAPDIPAGEETLTRVGETARAPACILVRRGRSLVGSIPLIAGLRRVVPEARTRERSDDARLSAATADGVQTVGSGATAGPSAAGGPRFELIVLDWVILAGNLRGSGDFGSRVSIAWRRIDEASGYFSPPPIHPFLKVRLAQAADAVAE